MSASPLKFYERFGIASDLEYLTENLGLLLAAGVDVVGALESIESGVKSKALRRIIHSMREDIASGSSLSSVLEASALFPSRIVTLIKVGEESGQLVSHFKMVAVQEEKQRALRSKIRSALLYPSFVFIVTLIVGVWVSWFILPRLAKVFSQLKLELPLITKIVLGFGSFLGSYGLIAVPIAILCLGAVIYFLFIHRRTKGIGEYILFSLPGVKRLLQEVELARLGFILGGLLRAGVPILPALDSLREATESHHFKRLYTHVRAHIEIGDSLEQSFVSYRRIDTCIPQTVVQLIVTGGKSGTLAEVLLKIGAAYEEKSDASTRNLSVILEPILLFIVWIAVVSVALGVILPIYKLIGGINHH